MLHRNTAKVTGGHLPSTPLSHVDDTEGVSEWPRQALEEMGLI